MGKLKCLFICQSVLILILIISLICMVGIFIERDIIKNKVKELIMQKETLTNGTMVYEAWSRSANATFLEFYLFTIQNREEFINGAELEIKEIGPFIYREVDLKLNVSWSKDLSMMTYYDNTTYIFEPDKSYGSDVTTNVTTVNLVMVGMEMMLNKLKSKLAESIITSLLNLIGKEEILITKSVREILWGYQDSLLNKLKNSFISNFVNIPTDIVQLQSNGTDQLLPTIISTGVGNLNNLNQYIMWENQTSLDKWGSRKARLLYGTDGHLFHPNISREENITAFIDQIYRSGYFSYERDIDVHGLNCYQYGIPYEEMANSTINPQNKGFYSFGPSGLFNFTVYAPFNLPIFISKPHFLDADAIVFRNIIGLKPNRTKHDSYVNVEPLTGFVLGAAKQLQFNIQLNRSDTQKQMKNLREVLFPIFWASETGDASKTDVAELKNTAFYALHMTDIVIYCSMGLCGLIVLVIILCTLPMLYLQWKYYHNPNYVPLRNDFKEDWIYPPLLNSFRT
ncbi:Lysosome membrane protein 2-like [Oopsacas minuta]|uniref:Lysosome membrane protein 2-like n=1 Tax=Oopsacas minuta TaxID=111878 RepID=A0AAV7JYF4_9METZ|nr:Lysosome membrane protein 2-like [Oopsacas minuta]